MMTALSDRFWPKVDRRGDDECWLWLGAMSGNGYGAIGAGTRAEGVLRAHRVAYELTVGPIPSGLVLDHLCRTPACVNPAHLEPVTQAENMRRGLKTYSLRGTCKHGHDITESANVYTRPSGRRECRVCKRRPQ